MKSKRDHWANLLLGLGYVFSFTMFIAHIMYPDPPVLQTLAVSVIAFAYVNLMAISRVLSWINIGVAALGGIFITFVCWIDTPISQPVLYIVEGIIDLWYCLGENIPLKVPEMLLSARICLVLTAFLASIAVFFIYIRYFSFYLVTGFSLVLAIFSWFMTAKENHYLFGAVCALTILSYIRHVYKKRSKSGLVPESLPLGTMLLYTLPLALLPVILISCVPKKDQPIEWPWLDEKIAQVFDYFDQKYRIIDVDDFSLASTGFSGGNKRLGGPVRPNNTVVMEVQAVNRTYLRGAAYSTYKDNSWLHTSKEVRHRSGGSNYFEKEIEGLRNGWPFLPVDKLFSSASEEDLELLRDLAKEEFYDNLFPTYTMEIKYKKMTTQTVFTPLKTVLPILNEDNSVMDIRLNDHGVVKNYQKLPSNTIYKVNYVQPMYGDPLLKKALEYSYEGLYRGAINILSNELITLQNQRAQSIEGKQQNLIEKERELNGKINTLIDLERQSRNIRYEYTTLSPMTSEIVREFAQHITRDCTSDYQKVVAIEQYLRDNYKYSLSPDYVPKGKDFVENFLFSEKQGYCTYFATSMTVLLRSLGIPARYVEGYVLPEKSSNDRVYTVTNRNAHAWVEVYFEGFGWLIFEPTPVYANVMNYRANFESLEAYVYQFPSLEEIMNRYQRDVNDYDYTPSTPIDTSEKTSTNHYLHMLPWILAGLVLLAFLVNYMMQCMGEWRMKRYKGTRKVLKCYEIMIGWLSHLGYEIRPGETIKDFSARMDELFILPNTNFRDNAQIFIKVRYGGVSATLEEVQKVELLFTELKKAVIRDLGIKRYIPLRYMLMGI